MRTVQGGANHHPSVTLCTYIGPSLFKGLNSAHEFGVHVPGGRVRVTEAQKPGGGYTATAKLWQTQEAMTWDSFPRRLAFFCIRTEGP